MRKLCYMKVFCLVLHVVALNRILVRFVVLVIIFVVRIIRLQGGSSKLNKICPTLQRNGTIAIKTKPEKS